MRPLGYECRHQHPGCACCASSLQKGFRRAGKRRDRQKAKRAAEREIPAALADHAVNMDFQRNAAKYFIEWLRSDDF